MNKKTRGKICLTCLKEIENNDHSNCFPKGEILVKKQNYLLIKVKKDEELVKKITSSKKSDNSEELNLLYVDNKLAGYKSAKKTEFVDETLEEEYKNILINYKPRDEKKIVKKKWVVKEKKENRY